jgi:ATP-binding cassette subfamily F protein uup
LPPIINAQEISKAFGAKPLFQNVSFTISEGDRIGLIGPNGSGKSTLLRILAGLMEPDGGNVAARKRTLLCYVEQDSRFPADTTVRSVIEGALDRCGVSGTERGARFAEILGRAGFEDLDASTAALSGGWLKRLAIVEALVQHPDILLLDEPTNHLDLLGIEWLEELLASAAFASVIVSHDRYFLENVTTDTVELNRTYPNGSLRVHGTYSEFLEKKEQFLHSQSLRQEALENLVHREIEWLRRGAKARTRKSKARIDKAGELMGELADLNSRTQTGTAQIDFSATDRKTRRLIELENVSYNFGIADTAGSKTDGEQTRDGNTGGRTLFAGLNFIITAGMRVGLVGPNGSGKTTLLRLLQGELAPTSGEIRRADRLRIVYFDQRRTLDPDVTLRRALAPDGDSVIFRDRVIHVAGWAARFLFTGEQLGQPVGRLSGGERARVLVAQLMLQPADILLLDEPTNDLDIPTLEILEENLIDFPGSLVLVTHDRYMLDRIATVVLGLNGQGGAERFADYPQWEAWQKQARQASSVTSGSAVTSGSSAASRERNQGSTTANPSTTNGERVSASSNAPSRKKLSYMEAREYAGIEQRIADAEQLVQTHRKELEDPANATDAARLLSAQSALNAAQDELDVLYKRWAELEEKSG